jgi:hypothetical protein
MVNEPSGAKSPAAFADAAKKLLRGKGVTVKVMTEAELKAEGLGGVVGVGQGSGNPPRLVKATYSPQGKKGSVAFVGKGVVFDSGGLSLKTSTGMETMKIDMSGAAAVLAAMSVLKEPRQGQGDGVRADGGEHAQRYGDATGRCAHDAQREDGRGAQHRCRGPAHPGRRAFARE